MRIGKQYLEQDNIDDTTGFKAKARLHQSLFRANVLGLNYDKYGNYLLKEDAEKGLNFYQGFDVFDAVKDRYGNNYNKPLYANMLRSEHIPFNMFIPFRTDMMFGAKVLNRFVNGIIENILKIEIEYAPAQSPSKKYLEDKTSFDAYIEYIHIDGRKGILGIEVKYTEREYQVDVDSSEYKKANNPKSIYYTVSRKSGLYKEEAYEVLKNDEYRQIWRNHILGESILQTDNDYKHFTSLTLFPSGNQHFVKMSNKYSELLNDKSKFVAITFEEFIKAEKEHSPATEFDKWLEYLEKRYV